MDLLSAWQAAEQHDPTFRAARAEAQAGETRRRQGRSMLLPQLALTGRAGYLQTDRDTTGAQFSAPGFGSSNDAEFRTRINGGTDTGIALTARQPIYNAERFASAQQLDHQSQLAEARFREARQLLILRTVQAYFDVLLVEDALAVLQSEKEAATRAFHEASESFEAGATPVTGRYEAQARRDEIDAQELAITNQLQVKRSVLADITGQPVDRLEHLASNARLADFTAGTIGDWNERAAGGNPLIQSARLGREIAREEIEKYRALSSPSVDLVAELADDHMQGSSGYGPTTRITSNTGAIGVQLTIPLFTGGMRSAKGDEAAALAEKASYDLEAVTQEVQHETLAAWLAVTTGLSRVKALETAVESARLRLDATETGRGAGARTTLDLMNAQADYYGNQHKLTQARYQLLLDRLKLVSATGELSEAQVRAVNGSLTGKAVP